MASSQASMVASTMMRFSNSSLQNLIRRHLFPTATTSAAATATVGLINNFPESLFRPPFFIETPNQQVFPIRMDEAILYGNRIGLAAFPGVEQARLFARGDPVKIDDEFNDEDADDDVDADDFEDESDFDDDFDEDDADEDDADDDDADPRYRKRK